jgi:hypothetical protein
MAASGFTPISLYYTTTAAAAPSAGNLVNGELAINITDGKLYYKDNAGVVKVIAGSGGSGVVAGSNTQVQFNNNGVFGASSNLTWNGTTLGVTGAITASADSSFTSTGAVQLSKGTTAERPAAVSGKLRFNTTTSEFEGYNGTAWASVGGAALSNDTTTATNIYPLSAAATSGTASTLYTSNAKFLYKPSTGELQASELVASNGIVVNSQTVSASYTIPSGSNAMSAGPVTVADGITVTVSDGSVWTVI